MDLQCGIKALEKDRKLLVRAVKGGWPGFSSYFASKYVNTLIVC